jgi:hypothetical protein
VVSNDLEERLRELHEKLSANEGWKQHPIPLSDLRAAAAIGDELGYARGRAEGLDEAWELVQYLATDEDGEFVPERVTLGAAHVLEEIDVLRAAAQRKEKP